MSSRTRTSLTSALKLERSEREPATTVRGAAIAYGSTKQPASQAPKRALLDGLGLRTSEAGLCMVAEALTGGRLRATTGQCHG